MLTIHGINEQELQQYGITLETYGPQSFNDDAPSFSADVPAADLVDSAQGFGEIPAVHGETEKVRRSPHPEGGVVHQGLPDHESSPAPARWA